MKLPIKKFDCSKLTQFATVMCIGKRGTGKTTLIRDIMSHMAKRLDFGVVWINSHIPFVAEMPHGGFKHSGYGKDLSMYGFEDYTRIKHVMASLD
jgi:acyl-CoA reductase-like NAD-dependent aldehyde dehydrogenase